MSDPDCEPSCPRCSGVVDTRTELASGICQDCGSVFENELSSQSNLDNGKQVLEDTSNESDNTVGLIDNWDEKISPNDASDQELIDALAKMDRAATKLRINPTIRERIAELVTVAWQHQLMHGRSHEAIVGACILIECQKNSEPRPLKIIAESLDIGSSRLSNGYQAVTSELDLELDPVDPCDYLSYFQQRTEMSDAVITEAEQLLSNSDVAGNPAGIAIAAIYLVAESNGEEFTYVDAAETVGLVKETIWKKADALRGYQ